MSNHTDLGSCPEPNPDWPEVWPEEPRIVAIVVMVASFFYIVLFSGLTIVLRHERPLVDRSPWLILVHGAGVLVHVFTQGLMVYLSPANIHCAGSFASLILQIPLVSAPLLLRLTQYRQQILFHREIRMMRFPQGSDSKSSSKERLERLSFRASELMVFLYMFAMTVGTALLMIVAFALDPELLNDCYGCDLTGLKVYMMLAVVAIISLAAVVSVVQVRAEIDAFGIVRETRAVAVLMLCSVAAWVALNRLDPGGLNSRGAMFWSYLTVAALLGSYTVVCVRHTVQTMRQVQRRRLGRGMTGSTTSTVINETFQDLLSDPSGIEAFLVFSAEDLSAMNFRFWVEANRWREGFYSNTKSPLVRQRAADQIYDYFVDTGSVMCVRLSPDCRRELAEAFNRDLDRVSVGSSLYSIVRNMSRARTRASTVSSRESGRQDRQSLAVPSSRLSAPAEETRAVRSGTSISDEEYDEFPQSRQPTLVPANVFDNAIQEVYKYMKNETYPLFRKSQYYQAYLHDDLEGLFASRSIQLSNKAAIEEVV